MSSRNLCVWLVAASALLAAACTALPPQPASRMPYFIDGRAVTVDRDYIERYACASGVPLVCRCSSTKMGNCDCSC